MTSLGLWPETDRRSVFAALDAVFENLPALSILKVPPDLPREQVDEWVAANRKPAKIQLVFKHDDQ